MPGAIARVLGMLLAGSLVALWLVGERWRPMRRSTRAFLREGGWKGLANLTTLHGYVYARWPKRYIGTLINNTPSPQAAAPVRMASTKFLSWLADHYHAKVLTTEQARAIITLDKPIPLHDLEQVIPYPTARNLVLAGPPDVAVIECACRAARENPCRPTQVCMVIGQPFVNFTIEHHPQEARRLSQSEALELLAAEHQRGHIHSAWFKDAMLDRFYVICNCCKCCCGGVTAMTQYGIPMLASSGYVSVVDAERCTACAVCVDACPFGALSVDSAVVVRNRDKCMGCGVCVDQCASEAITLVRDEAKGPPLDVRLIV